jgi:hypothetical protein
MLSELGPVGGIEPSKVLEMCEIDIHPAKVREGRPTFAAEDCFEIVENASHLFLNWPVHPGSVWSQGHLARDEDEISRNDSRDEWKVGVPNAGKRNPTHVNVLSRFGWAEPARCFWWAA